MTRNETLTLIVAHLVTITPYEYEHLVYSSRPG